MRVAARERKNGESVFTVIFPVTDLHEEKKNEAQQKAKIVLLVDDDPDVRTVVQMMLEQVGFSVLSAADGFEAVEIFKDKHDEIDCILLDMRMPGMDGRETFKILREIREDVPVIVSSGQCREDITDDDILQNDGTLFLEKPFRHANLISTLNEALAID